MTTAAGRLTVLLMWRLAADQQKLRAGWPGLGGLPKQLCDLAAQADGQGKLAESPAPPEAWPDEQ